MKIKFKPWGVPGYAVQVMPYGKRQDGLVVAPSWSIKDIDAEVLSEMCDQFRASVFQKAGKKDPRASQ